MATKKDKAKEARFRAAIMAIRSKNGRMTQARIAERIGIGSVYLTNVMKGDAPLSKKVLAKFRTEFGINPEFLTGKSDRIWYGEEPPVDSSKMTPVQRFDAIVYSIMSKYGFVKEKDLCRALGVSDTFISDVRKGKSAGLQRSVRKTFEVMFGINQDFFAGTSNDVFLPDGGNAVSGVGDKDAGGRAGGAAYGMGSDAVSRLERENESLKEQLEKSAERIDRLISVLEKMQGL